jgi:hypothetical protein
VGWSQKEESHLPGEAGGLRGFFDRGEGGISVGKKKTEHRPTKGVHRSEGGTSGDHDAGHFSNPVGSFVFKSKGRASCKRTWIHLAQDVVNYVGYTSNLSDGNVRPLLRFLKLPPALCNFDLIVSRVIRLSLLLSCLVFAKADVGWLSLHLSSIGH